MKPLATACILLVAWAALVLGAACGGRTDASPTPAPSPTPEPLPFTVTGPRNQIAAFAQGEWSYFSEFVLDVATGEVYTIDRTVPDDDGPYAGPLQWISDDTLVTGDGYAVTLDGRLSPNRRPLATTTPAVSPDVPKSADGLWSAERNLAISGITLTEASTGRRFDVRDTDAYQWAPAGHLMATGGGWCGGGRISIVDPDASSITGITQGGESGHGVVYVWRPDGRALALDLLSPRLSLALVDAKTGAMTTPIAPAENVGEFVPLAWNPSGTHLLFRIHGGRDCGN